MQHTTAVRGRVECGYARLRCSACAGMIETSLDTQGNELVEGALLGIISRAHGAWGRKGHIWHMMEGTTGDQQHLDMAPGMRQHMAGDAGGACALGMLCVCTGAVCECVGGYNERVRRVGSLVPLSPTL